MKTETKGTPTPGPWTTGQNGDRCALDHAICAGPHVIAKVYGNGYPVGEGWHPESAANARLIAAAPELRDYVESIVAWGIAPDSTPATIADIVAEARALLARIDGIDA